MEKTDDLKKASFLVKVWKDSPDGEWRGQAEHIQSGRKASFNNWSAMEAACRSLFDGDEIL